MDTIEVKNIEKADCPRKNKEEAAKIVIRDQNIFENYEGESEEQD